jgi:acyl-CoA thioesterase
MVDFEKIKEYLNNEDRFCRFNGIRLTEVGDGCAEAVLQISENSLNGRDVVQGGAVMTLADLAFAGAINGSGVSGVTLNCTANFIRPGTGKFLRAAARKISQGKKTAVYNVEVFQDDGKLVATMSITGFIVDDKPLAG